MGEGLKPAATSSRVVKPDAAIVVVKRGYRKLAYRHPSTTVVAGTFNLAAILRQGMPSARSRTASLRRNTRRQNPLHRHRADARFRSDPTHRQRPVSARA
jgi:hypothetical protein